MRGEREATAEEEEEETKMISWKVFLLEWTRKSLVPLEVDAALDANDIRNVGRIRSDHNRGSGVESEVALHQRRPR